MFGKYLPHCALLIALAGTSVALPVQPDDTAKQDVKDAGHSTKDAAKDTGRATKKGAKATGHAITHTSKKIAHKGAQKTGEGAKKVENKTQTN